jgi:hypothetical protein
VGGAVLAGLVLIPASSLAMRGRVFDAEPWQAFAQNSRKHLASASQNRMGLKALVSFDPAGRAAHLRDLWLDSPGDAWEGARARVFEQRKPVFWVLVTALLVLLVLAVDGRPIWLAAVLGTALMTALELACYYYALFLVFAFVASRRDEIAIGLCLLSAATSVAAWAFAGTDDQFLAISALTTGFAFAVLAFCATARSRSDA